jgi:hypothetical protein
MQRVLVVVPNVGNQIYDIPVGRTAQSVAAGSGVTDPSLYQEFADTDFDPACYNFPSAFTLTAGVVGFDLPAAKVSASNQAKVETSTQQQAALDGYTPEAIAGQASLVVGSRIPAIQAVIVATNTLSDTLTTNLSAIVAATTIDEVNNIVNPPYGEISTSRTGNDFNDSYYVTFYSASLTEADTELFIPATSTVISYILPTQFNAFSEAFTTGNYLVQIRETATGRVLADFICPEGAAQVVSY